MLPKDLDWTERYYGCCIIKAKAGLPFGEFHIGATHREADNREDVVFNKASYILAGKELRGGAFYHGSFDGPDSFENAKEACYKYYHEQFKELMDD